MFEYVHGQQHSEAHIQLFCRPTSVNNKEVCAITLHLWVNTTEC